MQKIKPFLWFDTHAEEAARFYVSIFKNSIIDHISYYGEGSPGPAGSVMTVSFTLEGQEFVALNGGPIYRFNPAISLFVSCETQSEVDHLWNSLAEGGLEVQCGWVTDKHGITWQVIPNRLMELLSDADKSKAGRVMKAMLGMVKIDVDGLERAYAEP